MSSRRSKIVVAVIVLFIAGAVMGGRNTSGDRAPGGTLAMRRTLAELGLDVRVADEPAAPPSTFVLLADFRRPPDAARIQQWVESGGRLILADPDSTLVDALGVIRRGSAGSIGAARLSPGCGTPFAAGVRRISVAGDSPLLSSQLPSGVECFHAGRGAFLVVARLGEGEIVVVGSTSPFTNELFGRDDNAIFAANVLGTRGPIVFGPPVSPGAIGQGQGLWATLPAAGKALVSQIALALLVFALARGRRLGAPLPETLRSPIPGGELVRATGRLLRSARATRHAGRLMREHLTRRANTQAPELSPLASRVLNGLEPSNDADLIELGRNIENIRKELEGADR